MTDSLKASTKSTTRMTDERPGVTSLEHDRQENLRQRHLSAAAKRSSLHPKH
jgi:hypothetical protein